MRRPELAEEDMTRLRMAVIGVGHLGKEHARILATFPEVDLVGVADVNEEQAQGVARRLGTRAYHDAWPLLNLVDAACIAVPTAFHCDVASEFLKRGIPLLVEKPLAATLEQAERLVQLANAHGALLQVGHIERFNPAFEELAKRPLQPKLVLCERLGPFSGRSTDIGVVLDLMIHDLDLLLSLVRSPVRSVEAVGVSVFGGQEDVANARLHFESGCIADLTASRAHPTPSRRMQLWGPEGYAQVDFSQRRLLLVQPSPQVRRSGLDPAKLDPASRARLKDDLFGRHLEVLELDGQKHDQLSAELQDFVGCVRTGREPRAGGAAGRDAIALAEQILRSLRTHSWDGKENGSKGPHQLPAPQGSLFPHSSKEVA
jgi:predicted dehydrogenase